MVRRCSVFAAVLLLLAVPACAEWSAAGLLGASKTASAALTLHRHDLPDAVWRDVNLSGRPFESPPYYGYRAGWRRHRRSPVGVEAELIHLKVYARDGAMAPPVEHFSISHGLNLLLGNVVFRVPLGKRLSLDTRAGAGVAIPHAESRVGGVTQQQYEVSSAAWQAAAGLRRSLREHAAVFTEYKLTTTSPEVHVADGTIAGRYTTQHAAAGVELTW
jgi:lipid A oxidase